MATKKPTPKTSKKVLVKKPAPKAAAQKKTVKAPEPCATHCPFGQVCPLGNNLDGTCNVSKTLGKVAVVLVLLLIAGFLGATVASLVIN